MLPYIYNTHKIRKIDEDKNYNSIGSEELTAAKKVIKNGILSILWI